ncbi:glycosyltransferase [Polynucleobacter paneuropaeus]|nr:glycosyltransferase [Polynucleobacter paneuropaeus]
MSLSPQKGLVTAIVASYNHSRFLPSRIESLLKQTYSDIEVLVIDDYSSDSSPEILKSYLGQKNYQLVLREQNGGWVKVSNQGFELSRGEYILFANCDDDCDTLMVDSLVDALEAHPKAAVAFCRSLMVDEVGKELGDDFQIREDSFRRHCAQDNYIDGKLMSRFLMHSCVIPNLSAALIRKSCLNEVGLFSSEYKACSDWDLFFRIAKNYDFAYVAQPLNFFRQHGKTIRSATKGRITYDEFFSVLLPKINNSDFSLFERISFRFHVMYLWSIELVRPSLQGWKNFAHHAELAASLDPLAILLLPFAMILRVIEIPLKLIKRML